LKLSNALSRRQSLCGLRDRENKREKIEEAEAKKEHTLLSLSMARKTTQQSLPTLSCHLQRATRRIRTSPAELSVRPCTEKLDEENSKHAGLAEQNGFVPAHLHSLLRLVKRPSKAMHLPVKSVVNMI
jgi:hypothetical protein